MSEDGLYTAVLRGKLPRYFSFSGAVYVLEMEQARQRLRDITTAIAAADSNISCRVQDMAGDKVRGLTWQLERLKEERTFLTQEILTGLGLQPIAPPSISGSLKRRGRSRASVNPPQTKTCSAKLTPLLGNAVLNNDLTVVTARPEPVEANFNDADCRRHVAFNWEQWSGLDGVLPEETTPSLPPAGTKTGGAASTLADMKDMRAGRLKSSTVIVPGGPATPPTAMGDVVRGGVEGTGGMTVAGGFALPSPSAFATPADVVHGGQRLAFKSPPQANGYIGAGRRATRSVQDVTLTPTLPVPLKSIDAASSLLRGNRFAAAGDEDSRRQRQGFPSRPHHHAQVNSSAFPCAVTTVVQPDDSRLPRAGARSNGGGSRSETRRVGVCAVRGNSSGNAGGVPGLRDDRSIVSWAGVKEEGTRELEAAATYVMVEVGSRIVRRRINFSPSNGSVGSSPRGLDSEQHNLPEAAERGGGTLQGCRDMGCRRRPLYAFKGARKAIRCPMHRSEGMVNVRHPLCQNESCFRQPSFGVEGDQRASFCSEHRLPDMVNVSSRRCRAPQCLRHPNFGHPGDRRASYCCGHKAPGMVDVVSRRCQHSQCMRRPLYAMSGQRASFCSAHKDAGMTDVVSSRCQYEAGCNRHPSFGWKAKDGKARRCAHHRLEGMESVKVHRRSSAKVPAQ